MIGWSRTAAPFHEQEEVEVVWESGWHIHVLGNEHLESFGGAAAPVTQLKDGWMKLLCVFEFSYF